MKHIKFFLIFLIPCLVVISGVLMVISPSMHKPFQFSVVEYIIKINSDNSTTTIKKVTDYKIKKGDEWDF